MNSYFINHPEMIVGKMVLKSSQYGFDSVCELNDGQDFKESLFEAISHIDGTIDEAVLSDEIELPPNMQETIPADSYG